jgi:hypothetical protein
MIDEALRVLGNSIKTLYANQQELTKSQNLLDEQFAVSTRMAVMGINLLLEKVGAEERLDADDIAQLFRDWATFRSRPDFRNLMMEWMLGVALDKLPAPPEPEAKKGEVDAKGDDGNKVTEEGQSENSTAGQEDDVPEVQSEDRAAS